MATYYISTAGDDSTGDGSEGNPWASYDHAYQQSVAGDTIILMVVGGVRTEYAWPSEHFRDRTVEGQAGPSGQVLAGFDGGGAAVGDKVIENVTLRDLVFERFVASGQFLQIAHNVTTPITLDRCRFHDIEMSDMGNYDGIIAAGIGHASATTGDLTLRRCSMSKIRFTGSGSGGIIGKRAKGNVPTWTLHQCAIHHDAGEGAFPVIFEGVVPALDLKNNIIVIENGPISFGVANNSNDIDNNGFVGVSDVPAEAVNTYTDDPNFADPAAGDLTPGIGSPYRERGIAL
ncbi:MAG: hypothetical protein GVY18_04495 [Bacteroidetes bacterium]|jgi:hypothetical protein|nr:hypothetical protein [Bacteroidota bacterium]